MCLALQAQAPPPSPRDPTPKDVRDFIRTTADALTNRDSRDFLSRFDGKMPGFDTLNYEIEALTARDQVLSVIEIVSDVGDEAERTMQIDWILTVDTERPRRQVVKVKIEKHGKKWTVTSLEPIEFFKPPAN